MAGLRQRSAEKKGYQAEAGGSTRCDRADEQVVGLVRTIEGEIIPRLMLAHVSAAQALPPRGTQRRAPSAEDVTELARLVIAHDAPVALAYVEALRAQGMGVEAIYVQLLGPVARELGEFWIADTCDFTQVTVGLWRLQQVLRALSPTFQNEVKHAQTKQRALLVPLPGEQHVFGVMVVAEFFRRAGWDVSDEPCATNEELEESVRLAWFDIAGLSVSSAVGSEGRLAMVAASVRAIRRASRNRSIGVMVGGRIFIDHPEYVALVGADATEKLLRLLARPG
jgi:methanogenic corrinoid protein MtbC1